MNTTKRKAAVLLFSTIVLTQPLLASAITIDTVPVGNAGNVNDPVSGSLYGGVAYDYRIGTTEVTVSQYTAFLNAVAATDTYGLYDPQMATRFASAGIARSGVEGEYVYSVFGSANRPVTYASWGDAARFSNWLQNGQPTGGQDASTTENGAYTLNGAMTSAELAAAPRNAGATWFIPSENEWYKATYHKNDGVTSNYWTYPTSSDTVPTSDQPPGSDSPLPSNTANFYANDLLANGYNDGYAATGTADVTLGLGEDLLTDAGAYSASKSPYGTLDQGGNVWEWTETLFNINGVRQLRGGSWGNEADAMRSSVRNFAFWSALGIENSGFRVATVPEPATLTLATLGLLALVAWRARRGLKGAPTAPSVVDQETSS